MKQHLKSRRTGQDLRDHPAVKSGWQSLDTAPKTGTKFIALTADFEYGHSFNHCVQEAKWSGRTPDDRIGHFSSSNGQMVVAWMPIPPYLEFLK